MPDKLEVLPGPGLVARFGDVVVWAGAQATAALQAHLVNEAQRLGQIPSGGDQLANSLIGVLQRGDPEPQSPFAALGPGANGLTLFLHGPVQAWDSGRWLFPQPVPGWMVAPIGRPWPLIVLPYGAPPPPQSQQGNPLDLLSGAVPGAGFILLRPPSAPAQSAPVAATGASYGPQAPIGGVQAGTGTGAPYGPFGSGPAQAAPGVAPPAQPGPGVAAPAEPGPGVGGPVQPGPSAGAPFQPGPQMTAPPQAFGASPAPTAVPEPEAALLAEPKPEGPLDLRAVGPRLSTGLPLAWTAGIAGNRPESDGLACPRGHLNHPRASVCSRCGASLTPGGAQTRGARPPVGALLADDGSIYSLSTGYLIGSDPSSAAEVQSGGLFPLAMRPGPGHTMAPVQAEIQVRGWATYFVDRAGGSSVQGPTGDGWSELKRGEQRELTTGSHISCGGRVFTFVSSWPA